jgi:hypothetical protein
MPCYACLLTQALMLMLMDAGRIVLQGCEKVIRSQGWQPGCQYLEVAHIQSRANVLHILV